MEIIAPKLAQSPKQLLSNVIEQATPFSQVQVTITKEEHIDLIHHANYWKAQYDQMRQKNTALNLNAKIKDLQNRLFGKKSEKKGC